MRWLRELSAERDRGATMVTFALLTTVIFAFIGLGVDGALFYAKKQEAQNGADAGALAIAQEHAVDSGCVQDFDLADQYAASNATWESSRHVAINIDCPEVNKVTVETGATFNPFFSQVIGIDEVTARASATVEWGTPYKGTPVLPITFSVCDFDDAVAIGGVHTLYLPKHAPAGYAETCERPYGSDENIMPAGFGYLGDGCRTEIDITDPWVESQTGNTPKNCDAAEMKKWVGSVILLPVFDMCRTGKNNPDDCDHDGSLSPSSRQYHIKEFAAWRLDGFYLNNTFSQNPPCGPPRSCVRGEFVDWVAIGEDFEIGPAPDTDTLIVRFTD